MSQQAKSPAELELELHELRLQLAASQERESKCSAENSWLLKGMAMLTRPQSIHSLFDALIAILRPLIGFEHATILVLGKTGAAATLRGGQSSPVATAELATRSLVRASLDGRDGGAVCT